MNDGADDIYSLLNYTSLVPSALDSSALATDSNWQIAVETKDDISDPSVPVVALDDGRFVLQNNGQLFLLTVQLNNANAVHMPKIESGYILPTDAALSEVDTNIISVDEVPKKEIVLSGLPASEDTEEKFVFLCAQCSDVFGSVEQCKDHMIKDHNMIISSEIPDAIGIESEIVQLPLQPIDTNSNSDKSTSSNETTIISVDEENESKNNSDNQENSNTNSGKIKSDKSEENENDNQNKDQSNAKLVKFKRKKIESDPDYDLRPFKCKHISCVQRFRSQESLQQHAACHQAPTRREYACSQPGCQLKYDDWRQCAMHLWQAHAIDVDLYTCWMCDQHKAASRMALETHMRIHCDVREFNCPECGKAFKQKAQLRNHRVTHIKKNEYICPDAVTPRWYMEKKCDICFKTYADSKCLKKHIQAVHSKLKPYVCQVCGHSSARKAMLQAHLRQHTGEKPYACNTCNFKTGDHNSLRRHMMRHSGVRPYKCPHCSYASIQSTSFKNHLQIRHPGKEGVFHCQHCSYRTVSHASFLQHLSDHNNNLISSSTDQSDVQVFPENVAAAQLIYHCLSGAYQPDGSRGFKPDVTASSTSGDGTKQTITIEIPTNSSEVLTTDDEDTTHCFLQPDEVDAGGITIPADPGDTNPNPGAIPGTNPAAVMPEAQPQPLVTHLVDFT